MCIFGKKLKPTGTIDLNLMSSILLDYDEDAEIYLPDNDMKVYKMEDVIKYLSLDLTNIIIYTSGHDCDDFAAELFGKGFGLVWTTRHALNWFIDGNNKLWFVEPQTDKISTDTNMDVRFFLGR